MEMIARLYYDNELIEEAAVRVQTITINETGEATAILLVVSWKNSLVNGIVIRDKFTTVMAQSFSDTALTEGSEMGFTTKINYSRAIQLLQERHGFNLMSITEDPGWK